MTRFQRPATVSIAAWTRGKGFQGKLSRVVPAKDGKIAGPRCNRNMSRQCRRRPFCKRAHRIQDSWTAGITGRLQQSQIGRLLCPMHETANGSRWKRACACKDIRTVRRTWTGIQTWNNRRVIHLGRNMLPTRHKSSQLITKTRVGRRRQSCKVS